MALNELEERAPLTPEEIKSDLRARCAGIPPEVWQHFMPDCQIPLGEYQSSLLLPPDGYCLVDPTGKPLTSSANFGREHNGLVSFLNPKGRIMEKLVDYLSDDPDSGKGSPDKILGETTEERYRWAYPIAVQKLEWLKKRGAELLST